MGVVRLWLNLCSTVFFMMWFGGWVVLVIRANAKGAAYLNRHPLLDGVPLSLHTYADRFRLNGRGGPVWRVCRQQQTDPELEHLRQEVWHRFLYIPLWMFGFPALVGGVFELLIVAGFVQ